MSRITSLFTADPTTSISISQFSILPPPFKVNVGHFLASNVSDWPYLIPLVRKSILVNRLALNFLAGVVIWKQNWLVFSSYFWFQVHYMKFWPDSAWPQISSIFSLKQRQKQIKQSETPFDKMLAGEKRIHLGYIRILNWWTRALCNWVTIGRSSCRVHVCY